ncbi:MAG: hypothetical protein H6671_14655 [Anaerolineaceae bacterium]|nr:hypothetical protein [Anaerolineaceae bacterium]
MLEQHRVWGLFSLAEISYLRMEAMDLFEQCLTEGSPDHLKSFIDQQIVEDPPRVSLLREVAEDLHLRLLSLREYHADVREQVLRALHDDFSIDISPISPANQMETYHLLEAETIFAYLHQQSPRLNANDVAMLRKTIEASLQMAAHLYADVLMTQELYHYLRDWLDGLYAVNVRRLWIDPWETIPQDRVH